MAKLRNATLEDSVNPAIEKSPPNQTHWQRWRPHLLAFAFYTALTLFFAWPVVTNLSVGTPGHFPVDRNQNLWNFWWFKRSLLETQTNPYNTEFLFYPFGAKLYLHTFSPYNLLIGLPLQLIFGLVPTYSFIELLTFPLGGYGAWLLARYLVKNEWGALLAGLVWSFGPYHYVELRQDQLNLLSLQWLPFFILFMLKLVGATERRAIMRYGLVAAFFYFLTLMVDYYYAIYLLMFAGLYWLWQTGAALWHIWRDKKKSRSELLRMGWLTGKLAGAFGLGMLPYSPILLATIRETASPKYTPLQNVDANQVHSADLLQIFLPPAHHPWWGKDFGLWQSLGVQQSASGTLLNNWGAVLGYLAVGLSVYALLSIKGLWFWAFNALFWLLISFGPSLRVNGACLEGLNGQCTGPAMPYRWLAQVPFIGIGRFPERFMLMAQLSFAVLGAYGLARLLQYVPQRAQFGKLSLRSAFGSLVLALFFFESWPGILPPPDPITQPAFTKAIAGATSSQGQAILELPVTKHSNPDSPRMLYQIYHQKPITGGYISRDLVDPHRTTDYLLYDWLEPRSPDPDIVPPKTSREQLGLLTLAGMSHVVIYPGDFTRDEAKAQRLLDQTFGTAPGAAAKPLYEDSQAQVYAVPPTSLEKPVLVLGQGWNEVETVDRAKSVYQRWLSSSAAEGRVNLVVGREVALKEEGYTLEIQANSPDKPRRLQVLLNGTLLTDLKVQGVTPIRLAGVRLKPGDNILALRPDPADGFYSPPNDRRQLRLGFLSIKLD